MANNGIFYSSGNSLNFTTSGTTWLSLNSQGLLSGLNLSMSAVTANTVSQVNYIDFTTGSTNPLQTGGRIFFDNVSKALSYYDVDNSLLPIAMGQQLYARVYNGTGVQIDKGKVVTITGTTNGLPSIILAVNNHALGTPRPIGVAAENISNGGTGLVLNNGILSGITLNTFANGDILYLSDTTPGGYVNSTASLAFSARTNEIGYVLQTGSTTGKIYININNEDSNLTLTDIERNILEGNVISSGVYEYTGMTQGTGATINVAMARGWIVRNTYGFATLPDVDNIYYTGGTNIPLTNLATDDATFILINSASTLVQQTTFPTPQERRENIFLGKVVHPSRISITSINQTVDFDVSPMAALRDLWTPLKLINQGVLVSPTGTGMTINTSSGALWGNGIGWVTNQQNPDSVTISGASPTTFQYRTQLGPLTGGSVTTGNTTTIDPGYYDLNGVVTAVGGGSNSSTNQRVYLFPTGLVRIQLGQKVYGTLAEAVAGSQTETFVEYSLNRENGILIGILSLNKNASVGNGGLVNTNYAVFNSVSKFGEVLGGTGGLSTTTLQQAYDNSTEPEILINSTLDGLSIRNGTGGADNVTSLLQGQNTAGTTTSFIRADGVFSGTSIFGTGLTANTISASTYYNLPGSSSANCFTDFFVTNISGCSPVNMLSPLNVQDGLSVTGTSTFTSQANFTGGLSANTFSAGTYQNLPSFNSVQINGTTQFSGNTNNFINFSGINITITSAATNTLVFSAGTGGAGAVSSVTAGSGLSGNSTTGAITLINTQVQGITGITAGSGISVSTTDNVTTITNGVQVAMLTSDQTSLTTTLADITDLSFAVVSGSIYRFRFVFHYEAFNTSTGSRWTINGPTTSILSYRSMYTLGVGTQTLNPAINTYDTPATANASSTATAGNIAIVEGVIKPSANGTVVARFASEFPIAGAFIRAKEGSYVEYQKIS